MSVGVVVGREELEVAVCRLNRAGELSGLWSHRGAASSHIPKSSLPSLGIGFVGYEHHSR